QKLMRDRMAEASRHTAHLTAVINAKGGSGASMIAANIAHLLAVTAVIAASAGSGFLLAQYTDAALPYLDSFTTWGSILTTWMVARKILENWLYWLVIDSASIYLYLERGLTLTAALFAVYLIIVVFGYRRWLRQYRLQSA
ncbi:MAG: nicotinamide mononucleotide transporter, partial [Haliea sp.]